jgi:Arc/MetJ-type ribon-helix-helix transcriptional regulator
VSRQGIAFDYSSPAELYLSRRRGRHTDYRRFATAAEAVRYAVEELRTRRSLIAWMQVGEDLHSAVLTDTSMSAVQQGRNQSAV